MDFLWKIMLCKNVGRIMFKKLIKSHGKSTSTVVYAASISNQLIIYLASFIQQHMSTQKICLSIWFTCTFWPTNINSTWRGIKQKNRPWDHVQPMKMILQFQKKRPRCMCLKWWITHKITAQNIYSSFKCDPGFIDEAFSSLSQKVEVSIISRAEPSPIKYWQRLLFGNRRISENKPFGIQKKTPTDL
jgi:hypothetical protein